MGERRSGAFPQNSPTKPAGGEIEVRTVRFPGHPQETTENSVDLGHLRYVHGYDSVGRTEPLSVDGHRLESHFNFKRKRSIAGIMDFTFDISARTHILGLGYSFVDIREHSIGMELRLWVLATPVDGTLIDLSLASQVREIRNPRRWIVGLGFLPVRARAPIMNKIMAYQQYKDVQQDLIIWSRKRYVSRPRLARSDGEIMPFRAYCMQFYPEAGEATSSLPRTSDRMAQ